jgi:tetratricopeptide (TPR) repeat protein
MRPTDADRGTRRPACRHWVIGLLLCATQALAPLGEARAADRDGQPAMADQARAATLSERAAALARDGAYTEARQPAADALALRLQVHGELHAETAASRHELGQILQALDMLDEAAQQFELALSVRERLFGADSAEVGATLTGLGWTRLKQARHDIALGHYRRALVVLEQVRGAEHGDVARVLNDLGVLFEQVGLREQALPY